MLQIIDLYTSLPIKVVFPGLISWMLSSLLQWLDYILIKILFLILFNLLKGLLSIEIVFLCWKMGFAWNYLTSSLYLISSFYSYSYSYLFYSNILSNSFSSKSTFKFCFSNWSLLIYSTFLTILSLRFIYCISIIF